MAEVTAMRNNALPYPVYGVAWTIVFPLLDADGDLVTGASTPDSEVSKNGDTFADCTNEMTEIATSSGVYYLTLTATEMTADVVTVIAKSATAGMKTTVAVLYPRKLVAFKASATSQTGAAGTITFDSGASAIDDFYNGMLCVATLDGSVEARIINDYVGSTKVASVTPNWNTTPDSDDTFIVYLLPEQSHFARADVTAWNSAAVATPDTAGYPKVTIKDGTGTGELDTTSGGVLVAAFANNAITAAAINADALTAAKFASDVTTELQSGLATASALSTVASYLDTEIADIKTKTDQLVFTVSNQLDVNVKSNDGTAITAASGIQEVKVASIAANAITASSIASDAITDAKVASDVTIASVTGAVGSVTGNVGGNVSGSIGSLGATAKSDVNAEVLDVLATDTFSQPGQESPAATQSLKNMIAYLYKAWRNRHTQTSSEYALYADDGTTKDQEAAVSDNGTTFERGEVSTGA